MTSPSSRRRRTASSSTPTAQKIGTLTSNQNKILLGSGQIAPNVKKAVVSIEDQRFYEHSGVDFQGIGRALVQDVLTPAQQGASTITEQFVKNALDAQGSRTVLQKFREAALAYRLERHWNKDKILTEYLNKIYFGEGAYGIEAAARTYFGSAHPGCGTTTEPCASVLYPWEAAMLAGIIASPAAYDPKINPEDALAGATWCSRTWRTRATSPRQIPDRASSGRCPRPTDIQPPTLDSKAPYFTSWLRQQLVDKYGAAKAFGGGLKVKSTLDLQLQDAAEGAVSSYLGGPAADRVGGRDQQRERRRSRRWSAGPTTRKPFNLATQGHRQPGSSFKPFTLVTALEQGISPDTVYASAPQEFRFGKDGKEVFLVHNYGDSYLGSASIAPRPPTPTTPSTRSSASKAAKGKTVEDRTHSIARTIHAARASDPISTNPALVLGGLEAGVTPARMGLRLLDARQRRRPGQRHPRPEPGDSPVAFTEVTDKDGHTDQGRRQRHDQTQVLDRRRRRGEAHPPHVVTSGTGMHANIGDPASGARPGRPRTTATPGSAARIADEVTACVWVGYADSTTPMTTEYGGAPVTAAPSRR